jgi:hypothetical protein
MENVFATNRAETTTATPANSNSINAIMSVLLLSRTRPSLRYSSAVHTRIPSGTGPTSPRTAMLPMWKVG